MLKELHARGLRATPEGIKYTKTALREAIMCVKSKSPK